GIQPVLTALLALPLAGERLTVRQWVGIILGFLGVFLVTLPRLSGPDSWPVAGLVFAAIALFAITLASPWQKRFAGGIDLRTGGVFQYSGGFLVAGLVALLFETREVQWTPEFIFAITWLVVVLSIGAVSLLMSLLASGALVSTVSLMYLVPAVTAVLAFLLFGEKLNLVQLAGLLVSSLGVGLVAQRKATL
ncbi:MAG: DMT family transporter, partial [Pseudomonadota bacterium]